MAASPVAANTIEIGGLRLCYRCAAAVGGRLWERVSGWGMLRGCTRLRMAQKSLMCYIGATAIVILTKLSKDISRQKRTYASKKHLPHYPKTFQDQKAHVCFTKCSQPQNMFTSLSKKCFKTEKCMCDCACVLQQILSSVVYSLLIGHYSYSWNFCHKKDSFPSYCHASS